MFVDSHCHLDFDQFAEDRGQVIERAMQAGVDAFVTISIKVRQNARVLAVAEQYDNVYCTIGTLPHHASEEADVTAAEIVRLCEHPKVVGIGECGYDRFFGNDPWEDQQRVFAEHIAAARETQLPLVIHTVKEDGPMAETLREESAKGGFPILMHAYSGGKALAETALSLGAYFAFGGLLTYAENGVQREIVRDLPADRILIETDSPSLTPAPLQEQRNEPANIVMTAALVARLRDVSLKRLGQQTNDNFYRLFSKINRTS